MNTTHEQAPPDPVWATLQIQQLKARYCRWIDTKNWAQLPHLFTPDCRFDGMGWNVPPGAGPEFFVERIAVRHARTISVHHCHIPEIRFESRTAARGIWAMEDFVEWQLPEDVPPEWVAAGCKGFRGYGHYEERYALHDGQWRIGFLRLTRLRIDGVPVESPPARMGQVRASSDWLQEG